MLKLPQWIVTDLDETLLHRDRSISVRSLKAIGKIRQKGSRFAIATTRNQAMAQRYIPEITDGDKRILMIDGEPIPYTLARIPQGDEVRGNLAAGGIGEPRLLTPKDRWLAQQVGPELKKRGLLFVGLDVIGEYITEINVTSPTCIREIDAQYGYGIAERLMQVLERKVATRA